MTKAFQGHSALKLSEAAKFIEEGQKITSVSPKGVVKVVENIQQLCGRMGSGKHDLYPIVAMELDINEFLMNSEVDVKDKIAYIFKSFGQTPPEL